MSGARAKYGNANIGLDYQEQAAKQGYGLDTGFDDYRANPYSRAALLEQSFQRANRGTGNSYAAQGQLYAGSLSNALGSNRSSYDENRDTLGRAYRDALNEIQSQRLSAGDEMGMSINDAYFRKLEGAAQTPPDSSTAPEGGRRDRVKPRPRQPSRRAVIHQAVAQNRAAVRRGRGRR